MAGVPSQSHGYCQANLPTIPDGTPGIQNGLLRNHETIDNTKWLDSASHTDTYTVGDTYKAADDFMTRGHASAPIRDDCLESILAMQQSSELIVGMQPVDTSEVQLWSELQPAALQTELHTLLERNKETQSCGLAPLIEAIGILLHVRGSFGHRHAAGVVAGSNYQNTMVQLAAYFEESMAALTSARIAELVDAEVDELAARFAHPDYLPKPASSWPVFTSLATYLLSRLGHMATVRSAGVESAGPGRMYRGDKPNRKFKVVFKWSGGVTMGKETEVAVNPQDSIFDLKVALCNAEPSLSVAAIRLHVGAAPLGFNTRGANYDPSVDQEIIVGECGLAPGVEITLCTAASAYGSVHA